MQRLWFTEYSKLYSAEPNDNFDESHLHLVKEKLDKKDERVNKLLNRDITIEEVQRVVNDAKTKKACGLDSIPNEAIKTPLCVKLMHSLFASCFSRGLLPSAWSECEILPIGKGSSTVSTKPLTH